MWQKFKEQLPSVLVTVLLVAGILGGYAYYVNAKLVPELNAAQQKELTTLKEQHAAELKAAGEQTRQQIESLNSLLKNAIENRAADVFLNDSEVAELNAKKVDQLAEAVAQKMAPYNPRPKSAEEAQQLENEQVDRVSSRMAGRIQPILAEIAGGQKLTQEALADYSQRISDQVSVVLTTELAKNQQLNTSLLETQSLARESLALNQELTALYLSSFKDQGVITRILTLPANIVRDASKLSLVNSGDRKKIEADLLKRVTDLQARLDEAKTSEP